MSGNQQESGCELLGSICSTVRAIIFFTMFTFSHFLFDFLVHSQVTVIFVLSVGLSVCLFVQSFSQPSLIRFRSN